MLRKRSPLGNGGLSQGQEKGATFQDPAGGLVQTRRRGHGGADVALRLPVKNRVGLDQVGSRTGGSHGNLA